MLYPSVYRARAVQIAGRSLQAYVPQVFGDQRITIDSFVGDPPADSGGGWVVFQGGDPAFPVWLNTGISSAEMTDEVWVGSEEPADPTAELWYDPEG